MAIKVSTSYQINNHVMLTIPQKTASGYQLMESADANLNPITESAISAPLGGTRNYKFKRVQWGRGLS
jgi:hypothetical protein